MDNYTLFSSYSGDGLRWFVVMCGGLWWFAVVCGDLRWFAVICGGLSFSHTQLNCQPTNELGGTSSDSRVSLPGSTSDHQLLN